jgi:hypothetical protein
VRLPNEPKKCFVFNVRVQVQVELGPGWVLTDEAMINITFVVLIELRLASPKQWKIIQSVVQRHKAIAASRKKSTDPQLLAATPSCFVPYTICDKYGV